MKNLYFILVALMFYLLASCNEKSNNNVTITGQLEGVEDGVVLNLMKIDGGTFVDFQSDTVIGGKFKFSYTDTLNQSSQMAIMSDDEGFPPTWLDVWTAPDADIKITGKDKLLRTWDVNSVVPEQIEMNKYKVLTNQYERIKQVIMMDVYSKSEKMEIPEQVERIMAEIDSLFAINDSLNILVAEIEINIMDNNKTYSPLWLGLLERYASSIKYMNLAEIYTGKLKSMYESMSDELKNSEKGQSIYINLFPPTIVKEGEDMADADMWNVKGELKHLADYKGKYLLLDFWSAGCGPCIMAIPEMKEISEIYKDKLTVISISSDSKDIWESVSREKDITWVNLNDFKGENGIKLRYGVRGIPHYVMISPEGKVATSWLGYAEGLLKNKMEENIK